MVVPNTTPTKRGAFVLLEGVDRCGKTTQCQLLLQRLLAAGMAATAWRFPNRTTATGTIINNYLSSSTELDDRAIHLLFSANRWEAATDLATTLQQGTTVVCDRYAYSGVAFSASKVDADTGEPLLGLDWCQAPDRGLPAPDCVIFLDISQEEAEKRGGYGGERYETRELQQRVRQKFATLQTMDESRVPWSVINAAQPVPDVEADIYAVVEKAVQSCSDAPIATMWQEGTFSVPSLKKKPPVE